MENEKQETNKNILIAVDDSDNAHRAVTYVGNLLGHCKGFKILLLHVIPDPEEDYFSDENEQKQWLEKRKKKIEKVLKDYKEELVEAGFDPEDVSVRSTLRYCPSMAECILTEREDVKYDTIVVGRQGISRSEEFLFGSISSKIVTHAKSCTVWVVE